MRLIKKFLFQREVPLYQATPIMKFTDNYIQLVAVEGFNKDHAVRRLVAKWPSSKTQDWHFMDDLEPEHFLGKLGEDLPLFPWEVGNA